MDLVESLKQSPFLEGRTFEGSSSAPFALYFSAHWCPPCRAFTPQLVQFYDEAKKLDDNFEIVFVSADHSDEDMKKYVNEAKMPWLVLPFQDSRKAGLHKYCGMGIPTLAVFNADGSLITRNGRGDVGYGPKKCLETWKTRKGITSGSNSFIYIALLLFALYHAYRYFF